MSPRYLIKRGEPELRNSLNDLDRNQVYKDVSDPELADFLVKAFDIGNNLVRFSSGNQLFRSFVSLISNLFDSPMVRLKYSSENGESAIFCNVLDSEYKYLSTLISDLSKIGNEVTPLDYRLTPLVFENSDSVRVQYQENIKMLDRKSNVKRSEFYQDLPLKNSRLLDIDSALVFQLQDAVLEVFLLENQASLSEKLLNLSLKNSSLFNLNSFVQDLWISMKEGTEGSTYEDSHKIPVLNIREAKKVVNFDNLIEEIKSVFVPLDVLILNLESQFDSIRDRLGLNPNEFSMFTTIGEPGDQGESFHTYWFSSRKVKSLLEEKNFTLDELKKLWDYRFADSASVVGYMTRTLQNSLYIAEAGHDVRLKAYESDVFELENRFMGIEDIDYVYEVPLLVGKSKTYGSYVAFALICISTKPFPVSLRNELLDLTKRLELPALSAFQAQELYMKQLEMRLELLRAEENRAEWENRFSFIKHGILDRIAPIEYCFKTGIKEKDWESKNFSLGFQRLSELARFTFCVAATFNFLAKKAKAITSPTDRQNLIRELYTDEILTSYIDYPGLKEIKGLLQSLEKVSGHDSIVNSTVHFESSDLRIGCVSAFLYFVLSQIVGNVRKHSPGASLAFTFKKLDKHIVVSAQQNESISQDPQVKGEAGKGLANIAEIIELMMGQMIERGDYKKGACPLIKFQIPLDINEVIDNIDRR